MTNIFTTVEFWNLIMVMQAQMSEKTFESIMQDMQDSFPFREEEIRYKHEGKNFIDTNYVVEFEFCCGNNYSMILECTISFADTIAECEQRLFLRKKQQQTMHILGWWDQEHWHPLCIKPEESILLNDYWRVHDPIWEKTNYPMLMLKNFIGFDNENNALSFQKKLFMTIQALRIKHSEHYIKTMSQVPFYKEEAYRWRKDAVLGWVYESDIYNCYSIRNAEHIESDEDRFPFEEWNLMIGSL